MTEDDITALGACQLSQLIHERKLPCRALMRAHLDRIARLNPRYNAIVNLAPAESLMAQAETCDAELARGHSRGWMHGLPQAIKDTAAAEGFPTTLGSPLLARALAPRDALMAARLKAAGCIVIGKTNVPEFGLGSHTFNPVFGATGNAWDRSRSAGGSSGGAACALALRLLPVADGSDFMGSLRNPAAWNNVFGMRPSWGRVPGVPATEIWISQLATEGPMARNVADLRALLATQAGPDARSPLSQQLPLAAAASASGLRGLRVGWLGDLEGYLPMEAGLLQCTMQGVQRLADGGALVTPLALGFDAARLWDAWLDWRRALVGARLAPLMALPDARAQIKPEALWEYDRAQTLSFMDFMRASEVRSAWYQHLLGLFERFDVLALPVCQVWPFPIEQRWPQEIAGRRMDTYHRWMEATLYASFAGLPAISVPAGFHANGRWPAGLQLIGPPQGDAALLDVAAAYEAQIGDLLARSPDIDGV